MSEAVTVTAMRILVTNDDGIDSVGLHVLARAMRPHGEVIVAAPDSEYSGSGASLGSLINMAPELHTAHIDGIDEAWAIAGPPALCVMFGRLGAYGGPIDLVVSGINPGLNVGRSVYHSGTVGAALTARNGLISGVAVSQAVDQWGVEGQGWGPVLDNQHWDTAADLAAVAVGALVADLPADAQVLNINVPNVEIDEVKGWKRCPVGSEPPRKMGGIEVVPKAGHEGAFEVKMNWGEARELPPESDGGAVMHGFAALTWLSRLDDVTASTDADVVAALDAHFA